MGATGSQAVGYQVRLGPVRFDCRRDGAPITLAEAWRETFAVGGATIFRPDGSVLLREAGHLSTRYAVADYARRRGPRPSQLPTRPRRPLP